MPLLFPKFALVPIVTWCLAAGSGDANGQPVIEAEGDEAEQVTDEGKVALRWSGDAPFILQRSPEPGFSAPKVLYEGPEQATYITGLTEGEWFFRTGDASGVWSEPVRVEVRYVERGRVITLMFTGGIVFVATVGAVIQGYWRNREATV